MGKISLDIKEFRHVGKYSWLISLGSDLLLGFYNSEMCLSRNLSHRLMESDPPEMFLAIVTMLFLPTFIISKKINSKGQLKYFQFL